MDELDRIIDNINNLVEKLEKITIKLERHLAKYEATGSNTKWLKWLFDFLRTDLLLY